MKNITKDNKGITLAALIITIIIMLILVSVTTYTGIDTYKHSQVTKFVTQMQLLQAKVDDLVATKTSEELDDMELESGVVYHTVINNAYNYGNGEISSNFASEYKVFTKEDVLNILDVENVQNDILVNFETREIVDVVGVEYEETTYYTQYKLPGGQTIINDIVETNRDVNFELNSSLSGLNATITISNIKITNGNLSYKETDNNYWTDITNYTQKGKNNIVNISKSGTYTFRLQDNTNTENYVEKEISIILTNKPKTDIEIEEYDYTLTSEKWAYVQKDGINYVWIPRFAYKTNLQTNITEIKFIKGNSNISTDNTYVDHTWNVHDRFTTDNNVEFTGIWISVSADETNKSGLNMLTLLNDNSRTILVEI